MLTAVQVRNAKPKEKPYKLADGKGLYLFIFPNGKKSWRYRYRFNHKETLFTIGGHINAETLLAWVCRYS